MLEVAVIVGLVVLLYRKSLQCDLVVDDIRQVERVTKQGIFTRPFRNLFGWMKSQFPKRMYGAGTLHLEGTPYNIKADHVFTLVMYSMICVLIYFAFGSNIYSFWAAILYACNPVNHQISIWLNGRRYAMNIIILLVMLLVGPAGLVLYPMTRWFQVTVLFAPILYGFWGFMGVLLIGVISYPFLRDKIATRTRDLHSDDFLKFTPKRLIVVVKTYGFYFTQMILPRRLFMIYPDLFFWGMTEEGNKDAYSFNKAFWIGLISLVISGLGLLYFKQQMMYYWLFMTLSNLQWCNIIYATQSIADRYTSVPTIFMMYFISYLAHIYLGFYAVPAILCLCVYYIMRLRTAFLMYKDITAFYDYHNYFQHGNAHCSAFKAHWYINTGRALEVFSVLIEGFRRYPKDFKILFHLAKCCRALGDNKGALHYIRLAEQNTYIGQAEVMAPAIEEFKKSLFQGGLDIFKEMELIKKKQSKLSMQQRKQVEEIYKKIMKK